MLKRIAKIKNIGKFYDCSLGGCEFKDKTVIFGRNGDGKSTFTAILRSLSTGNNDILIGRKSFVSSGSKNIELGFEGSSGNVVYKFENKCWNNNHQDIEIFDTFFISKNIYDGEKVVDRHKTNLHQCVIGEKGKLLSNEINRLIDGLKEKARLKNEKVATYNQFGFSDSYTLEEFINLSQIDNIESKIEKLTKELQFNSQLNKPRNLSFENPDLDLLKNIFSKKFSTVHEEAQSKIYKHVETNWKNKDHSLRFLQDGISLVKESKEDANCPFCGQNLQKVNSLLEAYQKYFDEAYKRLQAELEVAVDQFIGWNIENQLTKLISEAKDWAVYFQDSQSFENLKNTVENSKTAFLAAKNNFDRECGKKKTDSNYDIDFIDFEEIKEYRNSISNEVEKFNMAIKDFCEGFESKDVNELVSAIGKLNASKDRHEKDWIEFCNEYINIAANIEALKGQRDSKIEELTAYSEGIFNKHEEKINKILENIGVDFKIDNFRGDDDRRRSEAVSCGFSIKFFGQHAVPIEGQENTPHFSNTLSQGDRGSLAFAFFLSLLFYDENLDKKIIVFDDPISSFDLERKRKTVQLLANVENYDKKKPLQTIVLTHEKSFLSRLMREEAFSSAIVYKFEPDGVVNGQKKCTMVFCDANEEFLKKETYKYLEEIKGAVVSNQPISDEPYLKCRKIMEAVFKAKYYLELKDDIWQNKGLRKFVDTLRQLNIYPQERNDKFTSLFNDLHVPHHDSNAPEDISENSQGDLKSILEDTLRLLKEI